MQSWFSCMRIFPSLVNQCLFLGLICKLRASFRNTCWGLAPMTYIWECLCWGICYTFIQSSSRSLSCFPSGLWAVIEPCWWSPFLESWCHWCFGGSAGGSFTRSFESVWSSSRFTKDTSAICWKFQAIHPRLSLKPSCFFVLRSWAIGTLLLRSSVCIFSCSRKRLS